MKKLKVLTVVGTRPEIIRRSRVMAALDRHVDHLNEVFFKDPSYTDYVRPTVWRQGI